MTRQRSARWLRAAMLCAALIVGGSLNHTSFAQEPSDSGRSEAAAVCMARTTERLPQEQQADGAQSRGVMISADNTRSLQGKGFASVACEAVGLSVNNDRRAWRDEICTLAAAGNEAVQNQLERVYGARPSVLCANAEAIVGQWQRGPPSE